MAQGSRASTPIPSASSTSCAARDPGGADSPGAAAELNDIATRLQSAYGKGRARHNGKVITGDDAEALMGKLRDPKQTAEVWQSWHENDRPPMRQDYVRMVDIANAGRQGARLRRHRRDVALAVRHDARAIRANVRTAAGRAQSALHQLHCYTRTKLNQKYGDAVQPATGPIRADLLGNMWAQEWGNIYDSSRRRAPATWAMTSATCSRQEVTRENGEDRRGFLHLARASPPLPTFW